MKIPIITILFSVSVFIALTSSSLMGLHVIPCTIKFPDTISKVPTLRMYCGGKIIPSTVDQSSKTVIFSIPKYALQEQFKLLVTEAIDFSFYLSKYQPAETNNTAAYVKLKDGQPYYLFTFTNLPNALGAPEESSYRWHIDRITNQDKGNKISDDAIILCMPPDWIQSMENNAIELPTIVIKSTLSESGSAEKKFFEQAVRLQLAAIDSDTLHAGPPDAIKQEQNRIVIAAPTA